ncbi:hypothetical protein BGZ57DRAFT_979957 [Hyaloscypha finlandica]|nr:hypothetical protein BGZ57DRAFT_979957 [Hyaloscypha finlandica]
MATQVFPRDASFVLILIHICIAKNFRYLRPTDYSKPPNSTGIINIGINSTLASMTESITNLLKLDEYSVDHIRDGGLWWDVGRTLYTYVYLIGMANATSSSKGSWMPAKLPKSNKEDSYFGIAVPVKLNFICSRDSEEAEGDTPLLCKSDHDYSEASTTCVMRLPLSTEHKFFHMAHEIVRMYDEREFDITETLRSTNLADHELTALDLGVDWETGLASPCTFFADHAALRVWSLRTTFLDAEKSFEEFVQEEQERHMESWAEEDMEELSKKWDPEVNKALDALAARGWKGHLVATCLMEVRGSEPEEGNEMVEGNESPENLNTSGNLETPD